MPHTIRGTRFLHVTDGTNPYASIGSTGAAMIELKTCQTLSKEDGKNGTSRKTHNVVLLGIILSASTANLSAL